MHHGEKPNHSYEMAVLFAMVVLLELMLLVLLEYLFTVPGGIIRWAFLKLSGKNKTLKECLKERIVWNYLISIALVVTVVVSGVLAS